MSIASLCNKLATFERKTVASDQWGGHAETFAAVYSGVSVSLQPADGKTRDTFLREGFTVSHMIYTATPLTLLAGDRAVVDSVYYIVQGPQRDMAGRGKAYSVPLLWKDA
jgi:hypothetical protein